MTTPEQQEIKAAIQKHLERYLETLDEVLQKNRFTGVGITLNYEIGKPLEVVTVEFKRTMAPAVSPPTIV